MDVKRMVGQNGNCIRHHQLDPVNPAVGFFYVLKIAFCTNQENVHRLHIPANGHFMEVPEMQLQGITGMMTGKVQEPFLVKTVAAYQSQYYFRFRLFCLF